jgi:hypothetical protein
MLEHRSPNIPKLDSPGTVANLEGWKERVRLNIHGVRMDEDLDLSLPLLLHVVHSQEPNV